MSDKSERLLELAKAAFPDLTDSERKVVETAATGDRADFQSDDPEKDDPAKAETWGDDRKVRASVLRWLCTDAAARRLVDPKGIRVGGTRIEGDLDLSFARLPFPLVLLSCAIPNEMSLLGARAASISLQGTHTGPITADGLEAAGSVFLRWGFQAKGEVRLLGARIRGDLSCTGGTFENPKGNALNADGLQAGGGVFLSKGFHAKGVVRLLGARIRGNLDCTGGTFEGTETETPAGKTIVALGADGLQAGGGVFLSERFHATGEVRLIGARIQGNLSCDGGTFENPDGDALTADGVEVGGDTFMRRPFHAKGLVRLPGARIRGDLDCNGGTFEGAETETPEGKMIVALGADRLQVGGDVFMTQGFHATGEVRLLGARIRGDLACTGGTFENPKGDALSADRLQVGGSAFLRKGFQVTGNVSLVHAKARVLVEDEASWPAHGDLDLEGFVYEGIVGPTDAASRLQWLARQYPLPRRRGDYHPQPYEQLAAVLRRSGHVAESKKVLMAKEKDLRKFGDLGLGARVWNWILGATIGYGYRVRRVLIWWAVPIVLAGGFFFWLGHRGGLLSPTFPPRAEAAAPSDKRLDETFCPWVYSLDTFLPIVDLHQEGRWLPNRGGSDVVTIFWPDRYLFTWGDLLCVWFWIEIGAGWLLTTLALAGLTGLIRRD